ncbi:MAG TPA: hypothetical protein GX503_03195 [Clostridiales bacterium]|nr:hypothetical protein [Clostridiales bacterium]
MRRFDEQVFQKKFVLLGLEKCVKRHPMESIRFWKDFIHEEIKASLEQIRK